MSGDEKFDRSLKPDDLIHYSLNDAPEPKIGEKYVLFLADDELLPGGYAVYGEFMGKYFVGELGLSRHVPESEPYIYGSENQKGTQETLEDIISAAKNVPLQDKNIQKSE